MPDVTRVGIIGTGGYTSSTTRRSSQHWLPFLIVAAWIAGFFVPNMRTKDASLSRYDGFAAYKARSGLLLPRVLVPRAR